VAKAGTSNSDSTISLKRLYCVVENIIIIIIIIIISLRTPIQCGFLLLLLLHVMCVLSNAILFFLSEFLLVSA